MTSPTLEQMRALVDFDPVSGDLLHYLADARAALRAAADQIEARDTFAALRDNGGIQ